MGTYLDQDLLLAQIFTLGTKDKCYVRSGTSRMELWKENNKWNTSLGSAMGPRQQGESPPSSRGRRKAEVSFQTLSVL